MDMESNSKTPKKSLESLESHSNAMGHWQCDNTMLQKSELLGDLDNTENHTDIDLEYNSL